MPIDPRTLDPYGFLRPQQQPPALRPSNTMSPSQQAVLGLTQPTVPRLGETQPEYEARLWREEGASVPVLGDIPAGLLRTSSRTLGSLYAGAGGLAALAAQPLPEDTAAGGYLRSFAQTAGEMAQRQQQAEQAVLPQSPTLGQIALAATEAEQAGGTWEGVKAGARAAWDAPDKWGAATGLIGELAGQAVQAAALGGAAAPAMARVTGAAAAPTLANVVGAQALTGAAVGGTVSALQTFGSNVAERMDKGEDATTALVKGIKQTGAQAIIDAAAGAVMPIRLGKNQWVNAANQAVVQALSGGAGEAARMAAIGEKASFGDILLEALVEIPGAIPDAVGVMVAKKQIDPMDTLALADSTAAPRRRADAAARVAEAMAKDKQFGVGEKDITDFRAQANEAIQSGTKFDLKAWRDGVTVRNLSEQLKDLQPEDVGVAAPAPAAPAAPAVPEVQAPVTPEAVAAPEVQAPAAALASLPETAPLPEVARIATEFRAEATRLEQAEPDSPRAETLNAAADELEGAKSLAETSGEPVAGVAPVVRDVFAGSRDEGLRAAVAPPEPIDFNELPDTAPTEDVARLAASFRAEATAAEDPESPRATTLLAAADELDAAKGLAESSGWQEAGVRAVVRDVFANSADPELRTAATAGYPAPSPRTEDTAAPAAPGSQAPGSIDVPSMVRGARFPDVESLKAALSPEQRAEFDEFNALQAKKKNGATAPRKKSKLSAADERRLVELGVKYRPMFFAPQALQEVDRVASKFTVEPSGAGIVIRGDRAKIRQVLKFFDPEHPTGTDVPGGVQFTKNVAARARAALAQTRPPQTAEVRQVPSQPAVEVQPTQAVAPEVSIQQEAPSAQQIQEPRAPDGGGVPQPGVQQEVGRAEVGGVQVQQGGPSQAQVAAEEVIPTQETTNAQEVQTPQENVRPLRGDRGADGGAVPATVETPEGSFIEDPEGRLLDAGKLYRVVSNENGNLYLRADDGETLSVTPSDLAEFSGALSVLPAPKAPLRGKVAHSSPFAGIEKQGFKSSKMLSGEGRVAYGAGTYFETADSVRRFYQAQFSARAQEVTAAYLGGFFAGVRVSGRTSVRRNVARMLGVSPETLANDPAWSAFEANGYKVPDTGVLSSLDQRRAVDYAALVSPAPPLYFASRTHTENYVMDWNKPISEQTKEVQDALKAKGLKNLSPTGRDLYRWLATRFAPADGTNVERWNAGSVRASKWLDGIGVVGHKYRNKKGDTNYVVYNPESQINEVVRFRTAASDPMSQADGTAPRAEPTQVRQWVSELLRSAGLRGWERNAKVFDSIEDMMADPAVAPVIVPVLQAQGFLNPDGTPKPNITIPAFFYDDKLIVVANQYRSRNHVERVILRHELQTHAALDTTFGDAKQRALLKIKREFSKGKSMEYWGRRLGFWDQYQRMYVNRLQKAVKVNPTAEDRARGYMTQAEADALLVEEFLALAHERMVQTSLPDRLRAALKEFFGWLRNWLRKAGYTGLSSMSESDLMFLLRTLRKNLAVAERNGKLSAPTYAGEVVDLSAPLDSESVRMATTNDYNVTPQEASESMMIPEVRDAQGRLLAPNGQPSNLNEFQWRQVRTVAFKNWFGDWENDPANASKVVDENGEPLVVYHGTGAEFYAFEKRDGSNTNDEGGYVEWSKVGFNFSSSKAYASMVGLNVHEVFLSIDNLREITIHDWDSYLNDIENGEINGDDIRTDLELDGYNGLSMEVKDNGIKSMHFIAFDPNQIKSATGNVGTFSPNTPDIRFAAETINPETNAYAPEDMFSRTKVNSAVMQSLWRHTTDFFRIGENGQIGTMLKYAGSKQYVATHHPQLQPLVDLTNRLYANIRSYLGTATSDLSLLAPDLTNLRSTLRRAGQMMYPGTRNHLVQVQADTNTLARIMNRMGEENPGLSVLDAEGNFNPQLLAAVARERGIDITDPDLVESMRQVGKGLLRGNRHAMADQTRQYLFAKFAVLDDTQFNSAHGNDFGLWVLEQARKDNAVDSQGRGPDDPDYDWTEVIQKITAETLTRYANGWETELQKVEQALMDHRVAIKAQADDLRSKTLFDLITQMKKIEAESAARMPAEWTQIKANDKEIDAITRKGTATEADTQRRKDLRAKNKALMDTVRAANPDLWAAWDGLRQQTDEVNATLRGDDQKSKDLRKEINRLRRNVAAVRGETQYLADGRDNEVTGLPDRSVNEDGSWKAVPETGALWYVTEKQPEHLRRLLREGYVPQYRHGPLFLQVLRRKEGATPLTTGEKVDAYEGHPDYPRISYEDSILGKTRRDQDLARLKSEYAGEDVYFLMDSINPEAWKLYQTTPVEVLDTSREFIATMRGYQSMATEETKKSEAYKDLVRITDELERAGVRAGSIGSRLMVRKGYPGYDPDIYRAVVSYLTTAARAHAGSGYWDEASRMVRALPENGIQEFGQQHVESLRDPEEEFQGLRSFLYHWNLAGTIAPALMNWMALPTLFMPAATQWFGHGESAATIMKYLVKGNQAAWSKNMKFLFDGDTTGLRTYALKALERSGDVAPQNIFHLMAIQSGSRGTSASGLGALVDAALNVWSTPFALSEEAMRYAGAAATSDLVIKVLGTAESKTTSVEQRNEAWDKLNAILTSEFGKVIPAADRKSLIDAVRDAKAGVAPLTMERKRLLVTSVARMMNDKTMFKMTKENRMRMARGLGAPVMTFRTYPLLALEALRSLPRKQQGYALLAMLFLGGLAGLPFAEDMEDILDTYMEWLGKQPKFTERMLREYGGKALDMAQVKGDLKRQTMDFFAGGISEVEEFGLPHWQANVSFGNILPGTTVFMPSEQNKLKAALEFFGVTGGMIEKLTTTTDEFGQGQSYMGWRGMMPRGLSALAKAYEQGTTGYVMDASGKRLGEATGLDVAYQALGFGNPKIRKQQDFNRDWEAIKRYRRDREDSLKDRIAKGILNGDQDAVSEAWDAVAAWNAEYPESAIGIDRNGLDRRIQALSLGIEERVTERTPENMQAALAQFRELQGR